MGLIDDGTGTATDIPCNYCFYKLFAYQAAVTSVSNDFLPATTLTENCYQDMFNACSSLIQAPGLPATTLAESCYQYMFYNCTSLQTAPDLPATTLVSSCYSSMFRGCTNLTSIRLGYAGHKADVASSVFSS
jgi:hypothetical protein